MDLESITLFSMLNKRLHWLSKRQSVLAQNVANVDTPGYKSRDLKPIDFEKLARSAANAISLRVTNPGHIDSARGGGRELRAGTAKQDSFETTLTGNAVDLEDQMLKVGQTRMDYDIALNLYRKHVTLLRMALRSGGR